MWSLLILKNFYFTAVVSYSCKWFANQNAMYSRFGLYFRFTALQTVCKYNQLNEEKKIAPFLCLKQRRSVVHKTVDFGISNYCTIETSNNLFFSFWLYVLIFETLMLHLKSLQQSNSYHLSQSSHTTAETIYQLIVIYPLKKPNFFWGLDSSLFAALSHIHID